MLNIATTNLLLQNCGVVYKRNTVFIEEVLSIFEETARIFVQTVKRPPVIRRK